MGKRAFLFQLHKLVGSICVFALVLVFGATFAFAESLDELAAKAEKEGPIIWYESSKQDQADKIMAAFNKRFPNVKIRHIRVSGGFGIGGRIIQETEAGGTTADVATSGISTIFQLKKKNLLKNIDWQSLGISPKLAPTPYSVITAQSVYAGIYNTKLVNPADVPQKWDDLLEPKWKGRLGTWVIAGAFGQLASAWGDAKTTKFLETFDKQDPILFRSTYTLAQQVAAEEIPVALGFYHTAQPPIRKGAPIQVVVFEPVPVIGIASCVPEAAKNPNGAKLFIAWLISPEGAKAYEDATYRGNALVAGTQTAAVLAGKNTSEFPPEEIKTYKALLTKYNQILQRGKGKAQAR